MIWDSSTGQVIHKLRCPAGFSPGKQYDVGWSPQGDRLAAAGADGTVMVWNVATGDQIHALKGHTSVVRSVYWSPDGRRLVSGSEDRTVRIWDSQAGRELLVLPDTPTAYPAVAWSPSGRMIGVAGGSLMIFDATIGYEVAPQLAPAGTNH